MRKSAARRAAFGVRPSREALSPHRAIDLNASTGSAGFPIAALRLLPAAPAAQRQPATTYPYRRRHPPATGIDPAGGGATAFEETVAVPPTRTGSVYEGNVDRREFVPGTGGAADAEISSGTARVRFDAGACRVTLPYRFFFQQQNTGTVCQEPPDATKADPLPQGEVDAIARRYVDGVNSGLANWFTVRLSGCDAGCAEKDIAVVPQAEIVSSAGAADTTITIVPRGGRGNAGTICRDFGTGFAPHEGAHQVLGYGDEYPETDPNLLQQAPAWGRPERVRPADFSMMHDSHSRFSVFHERHFRHVPTFLEAVLPGCIATLKQTQRQLPVEFAFNVGGGFVTGGLGTGGYYDLGLDLHLSGDRQRGLSILLGPHARLLATAGEDQRVALLTGLRIGIEQRWSAASGGPRVGGFAEAGAMFGLSGFGPGVPRTPYGELGISAGWNFGLPGQTLGIEAAAGAAEAFRGTPPGPADPPPTWLRFGVVYGGRF